MPGVFLVSELPGSCSPSKKSLDPACDTVDGRNPAPVDMENLPVFIGLYLSRWCRISSINSTIIDMFLGPHGGFM